MIKTVTQKRENSACAGLNSWRRSQDESWKKWALSGWNEAGLGGVRSRWVNRVGEARMEKIHSSMAAGG